MDFHTAMSLFQQLEQQRLSGQIDMNTYRQQLAQVRVVDQTGHTWMIQEQTGQWFVWDGSQWQPGTPSMPAASALNQKAAVVKKKRRGIWIPLAAAAAVLLVVLLVSTRGAKQRSFSGSEEFDVTQPLMNIPKPKQKDVIASRVLTEGNPILLAANGVSIIVSPEFLTDGASNAEIRNVKARLPYDNITINAYDFTVGEQSELNGIATIEIPYTNDDVADGYTAEECLCAVHYDASAGAYEDAYYEIDETRQVVVIEVTSLSTYGVAVNSRPGDLPSAKGNIDYCASGVFTPKAAKEPNFGPFCTDGGALYGDISGDQKHQALHEQIYDYDLNVLVKAAELQDNVEIIRKVSEEADSQAFNDYWLGTLSETEGYLEHPTTSFMKVGKAFGYTSNKLGAFNRATSHCGAALSLLSAASDLYYGKPQSDVLFSLFKNLVYYKGASAAEAAFTYAYGTTIGATAGTVVAIGLVGLFASEQIFGPLETWSPYSAHDEHLKLYGAYTAYYDTKKDGYRSAQEWADIVRKLNQDVLDGKVDLSGMSKEEYIRSEINREIEDYANAFWKLDKSEQTKKLIANNRGFLYGYASRPHYAGSKSDKPVTMHQYLQDIENGKYPGVDLTASELSNIRRDTGAEGHLQANIKPVMISYQSNIDSASEYLDELRDGGRFQVVREEITKNNIEYLKVRVSEIMNRDLERIYLDAHKGFEESLTQIAAELNKPITLNYKDQTELKRNEKSMYAGCVVVPKSDELVQKGTIGQWKVVLDDKGTGSITFSGTARAVAGSFTQVEIYKKAAAANIGKPGATPWKTVSFEVSGDENVVILPSSEDEVTLKADKYDVFVGEEVTFTYMPSGLDYAATWYVDGAVSDNGTSENGVDTFSYSFPESGRYTCGVTVYDKAGNEIGSAEVEIGVRERGDDAPTPEPTEEAVAEPEPTETTEPSTGKWVLYHKELIDGCSSYESDCYALESCSASEGSYEVSKGFSTCGCDTCGGDSGSGTYTVPPASLTPGEIIPFSVTATGDGSTSVFVSFYIADSGITSDQVIIGWHGTNEGIKPASSSAIVRMSSPTADWTVPDDWDHRGVIKIEGGGSIGNYETSMSYYYLYKWQE